MTSSCDTSATWAAFQRTSDSYRNGVGGVVIYGGRSRQVNVTVDPTRLQAYGLTITDVSRMLAAQNISWLIPLGCCAAPRFLPIKHHLES